MLKITKQSDYGILLISFLKNKKGFVPLSEMIKKISLPKRFLARVAAQLVQKDILESREGKVGGYRLSNQAKKLTLFDYLKIFGGDLAITDCMKPNKKCPWESFCQHQTFFKHNLAKIITKELKEYKLLQIV